MEGCLGASNAMRRLSGARNVNTETQKTSGVIVAVGTIRSRQTIMIFAHTEKGERMQMNQMEHELWKMAAWIVCPWCDERKCVGRGNCVQLAEWIVKKKEEIRDEQ